MAKCNINKDDTDLREELLQQLIDCKLLGPTCQVGCHSDPTRLSVRELPHGCWSNVYLLYQAHCRAQSQDPASKSTFFAVAKQWQCALRFHKKNTAPDLRNLQ